MGSPCQIQLQAGRDCDAIARAAQEDVERLERKYSRFRDDSVVARINASAGDADGLEVDAETAALLDYAETGHRLSDGLFDVTSGVLRRAWDFRSQALPTRRQVEALLPLVGWRHVTWQRPRLALPRAGMQIDLGGYVKEYAADRVAELCRGMGARHGFVDLGGDIAVIGPQPDGSAWRVGIRHPRAPEIALAWVELKSGAVATSGDYERFMIVDGNRYCHILDPTTGWPVTGLAGVSVIAAHCVVAGTTSTIAMLKGEHAGRDWLREIGLPHLCVDARGRTSGSIAPESAVTQPGGAASVAG
jgi:thiamine biosynthesis lipoprotein